MIDPVKIIEKYYEPDSKAYYFLLHHGKVVAKKAVEIARRVDYMNPDIEFIHEASILHDIGIFLTNAPRIGCFGYNDYICHGYLGRDILEREGLNRHALVCERHVGLGFSAEEIREKRLPLPARDMFPLTIEEKIICFADKFFSKTENDLTHEKPLEKVRELIKGYGEDKIKVFDEWVSIFL
jgi:uncharacterized protein